MVKRNSWDWHTFNEKSICEDSEILVHLDRQARSWAGETKCHIKAALLLSSTWGGGGGGTWSPTLSQGWLPHTKLATLPANVCGEEEWSKERIVRQKGISDQIGFLGLNHSQSRRCLKAQVIINVTENAFIVMPFMYSAGNLCVI